MHARMHDAAVGWFGLVMAHRLDSGVTRDEKMAYQIGKVAWWSAATPGMYPFYFTAVNCRMHH